MARPPKFDDDGVLDAAMACVARSGPDVTIGDVARELGGPVGSIYHRFASRDALMAALWLRSVRRFQAGLFELESIDDAHEALVEMALHVPRYCRRHPDEARALTLFRQERLVADCPAGYEDDIAHLNDGIVALAGRMAHRRFDTVRKRALVVIDTAVRTCPYGLVRPFLGRPVPAFVDEAVRASSDAILNLGDTK